MATFKILRESVPSLNRIEDGKLSLLATRIAHSILNGKEEKPFTDEELSKLETSLEMNREDVDLSVRGILNMFVEAAYDFTPSNVLDNHLSSFQIEQSKVTVLIAVWSKVKEAVCEGLRKKSVLPQVSHIAYSLSVQAGSDIASEQRNVKAQLQLGVKTAGIAENLDIEFTHEELYDLHSRLARIQGQLDAIADK